MAALFGYFRMCSGTQLRTVPHPTTYQTGVRIWGRIPLSRRAHPNGTVRFSAHEGPVALALRSATYQDNSDRGFTCLAETHRAIKKGHVVNNEPGVLNEIAFVANLFNAAA